MREVHPQQDRLLKGLLNDHAVHALIDLRFFSPDHLPRFFLLDLVLLLLRAELHVSALPFLGPLGSSDEIVHLVLGLEVQLHVHGSYPFRQIVDHAFEVHLRQLERCGAVGQTR